MVRYAEPRAVKWVDSNGGPLVAVPETVLPFWTGADGEETASDYDRACEVVGGTGLLPVGDCTALVLGDEPAPTTFLPDHGVFVRGPADGFGAGPAAAVSEALDLAEWSPETRWKVPGPVRLFDAARPGTTDAADCLHIALTPGRYAVRAARVQWESGAWLGLVHLRLLT